jgi:hypothetical protein
VQELRAKLEAEPDEARQRQLTTELKAAEVREKEALADKTEVDAKFAQANAVLDIETKRSNLTKTEADINIAKENARIAALNAAQARETNKIRREELRQKIDEAKDKIGKLING